MDEQKKLEYKIKLLKAKLKKAQDNLDHAYAKGFEEGFHQGQIYQINEIELEMYQPEGDSH